MLDAKGVILDLDGVLYRGDEAVPGARELLLTLHDRNINIVALTNHAANSPSTISSKLQGLGVDLDPDRIITSAEVAARFCAMQFSPGMTVALLGSPALESAFSAADLTMVPLGEAASVLVAGYTRNLTIGRLNRAVHTLLSGAQLVGTNPDLLIPDGDRLIPETGPLLSYLEAASGKTATVLGKPHSLAFSLALDLLDLPVSEVVMVGDTLYTDMAGATAYGLRSIWLNERGLPASPDIQPTRVASDLQQVLTLLV